MGVGEAGKCSFCLSAPSFNGGLANTRFKPRGRTGFAPLLFWGAFFQAVWWLFQETWPSLS